MSVGVDGCLARVAPLGSIDPRRRASQLPCSTSPNCSRSARNSSAARLRALRGDSAAALPDSLAIALVCHPLGIRSDPPPRSRPPVGNGSCGRSWTRVTTQQAFNALMIAYVPLGSVTGLVNPWVAQAGSYRDGSCGGVEWR